MQVWFISYSYIVYIMYKVSFVKTAGTCPKGCMGWHQHLRNMIDFPATGVHREGTTLDRRGDSKDEGRLEKRN